MARLRNMVEDAIFCKKDALVEPVLLVCAAKDRGRNRAGWKTIVNRLLASEERDSRKN
jgi:hypothetical protein